VDVVIQNEIFIKNGATNLIQKQV